MKTLGITLGALLLMASSAQAQQVTNWCTVNPTANRLSDQGPMCGNTEDTAWNQFDVVVLTPDVDRIGMGPWAFNEGSYGGSINDPQAEQARVFIADKRNADLLEFLYLHRKCDSAQASYACRPLQRIYDAVKGLTNRPNNPAYGTEFSGETGIAFAPAPGRLMGNGTIQWSENRHYIDRDRVVPEFPTEDHLYNYVANALARLQPGAFGSPFAGDFSWSVPYTLGAWKVDSQCNTKTCDRDLYSAAQIAAADAILAPPVQVNEPGVAYDAANGCYYVELCATVVP